MTSSPRALLLIVEELSICENRSNGEPPPLLLFLLRCGPVSSPLPRGRRRCDRDLRLLERPRAGNCYFGELFDLVKFVKIVRDAGLFISSALDHLLRPSGTLEAYEELHIIYSGDDEARGVLCLPGEAYHLSSD
ncbi:uncharacterized protein [Elaeis guineensis]|uniref:uncharacterized protein isoform X4 n=1 Tax=Elaeis guineensis var. tenera TaxID=51953 RepID=UPI003C6DA288